MKDLRNAIAHNDVVYDTRFRKMDPSRPMKQCLILEMGLPYINFKTIGDYIILICYFLELLKVSKTEIKAFIREFEKMTKEYEEQVSSDVATITVHPDLFSRMTILKILSDLLHIFCRCSILLIAIGVCVCGHILGGVGEIWAPLLIYCNIFNIQKSL